MKKMLLLSSALLVVCASVAAAAPSLSLSWDTCIGDGGTNLKTFSCTTNGNTGLNANTLIPQLIVDQEIVDFNGFDTHVWIATATPLPAWYGVGCTGKTSPVSSSGPAAGCSNDAFAGVGGGGQVPLPATDQFPNANATQIRFAFAVPEGSEQLLTPGEWPTCTITLNNAKSSGTGSCAGCTTPACLNFKLLTFGQKGGVATDVTQGNQAVAYWQATNAAACVGATPTHNTTWGSVKALYR